MNLGAKMSSRSDEAKVGVNFNPRFAEQTVLSVAERRLNTGVLLYRCPAPPFKRRSATRNRALNGQPRVETRGYHRRLARYCFGRSTTNSPRRFFAHADSSRPRSAGRSSPKLMV